MIPTTNHKPAWSYHHEYDGGDKACGLLIGELARFFRSPFLTGKAKHQRA